MFCSDRPRLLREARVVPQMRKQSWGCCVWPRIDQGARTEVRLAVWSLEHQTMLPDDLTV